MSRQPPGHSPHPQGPDEGEEPVLLPRLQGAMPDPNRGLVQRGVMDGRSCFKQKSLYSNDILRFYGYKKFASTVALQFTRYKLPIKSS